jgi:8-oxo-dGTP diphosphatase
MNPYGCALPGGLVDYGKPLKTAARREALEETRLVGELLARLNTYSNPGRDSRKHDI